MINTDYSMMMQKDDWDYSGDSVLKALCLGPKTFSRIVQDTNLTSNNVSFLLDHLIAAELVDVDSVFSKPEIYGLTASGGECVVNYLGPDVKVNIYPKDYWSVCHYVSKSKNRQDILKSLIGEVKSQSEISEDTGIHQSNISKFIKELSYKGLIVCFNPESNGKKLYGLTEYGAEVIDYVFYLNKNPSDFLNDMYFEKHYFDKDTIVTINEVNFKIPKGAYRREPCNEDWQGAAFIKECLNLDLDNIYYDSNDISIYVSSNPLGDKEVTEYDNPFEKTINGIIGVQSNSNGRIVFSYILNDKIVTIFIDNESILSKILINE